ncbi:hypothetical protein D046_3343B, partial [Vibrio parahaemolyticus V-223/04]
VNVA